MFLTNGRCYLASAWQADDIFSRGNSKLGHSSKTVYGNETGDKLNRDV